MLIVHFYIFSLKLVNCSQINESDYAGTSKIISDKNDVYKGIATTVRCCVLHAHVFLFFLAFDFCRFCVVIRFFHPRNNCQ